MALQQQLCCTPAIPITVCVYGGSCPWPPSWAATTTIVDLTGRRHRSIAPTRNNNPACQPNHIRIAPRANRISGREGVPTESEGQEGLSTRTHQTLSHDVQQSLSQPAGMVWFWMPSRSDSEATLFLSGLPGGEAEAMGE